MNRLTKIDRCGHCYTNNANCCNIRSKEGGRFEGVYFKDDVLVIDGEAIQKLGKLENLEEELGCSLEVVLKALEEGIYVQIKFLDSPIIDFILKPRLYFSYDFKCYCLETGYGVNRFKLKDYGKTWWLKGEKDE